MKALTKIFAAAALVAGATTVAEAGSCIVSGNTTRSPVGVSSGSDYAVVRMESSAGFAVDTTGDNAIDARFNCNCESPAFWLLLGNVGFMLLFR